jgi:hypothetical protein
MLRKLSIRGVVLAGFVLGVTSLVNAEQPETVMITLRARAGAERALAEVIARHYDVARRLNLVTRDAAHVTLRSIDDSEKTYFVEILTWRDAEVPDHAPREIQAIWKEMNGLVEARAGRPGLEIVQMTTVNTVNEER